MEGGYLLGQGTYGCIFDPPLVCEDEVQQRRRASAKKRMLGKVTLPEDYDIEEQATLRIRTIPNYENYFLPADIDTRFKPKAISEQKDTDVWKCGFLRREVGYDMAQTVHFKLKYGGVDSYSFICNPRTEKSCSTPEENLNWKGFIEHLLEAGALLALYQMVHYDIHRANILITPKTGLPKLIDFGQAFYTENITKDVPDGRWKRVTPGEPISEFEPPEVTMSTLLRKGLTSVEAYGQIIRFKEPLRKMESMVGMSREVQGREFAEFWRDSGAAREGDWTKLFQYYWPTFDAWNIGAVLLHLLEICRIRKGIAESADFRAAEPRFKEVLRGLLRLSPKRRLDCVEALNVWNPENKVVQSERGQAWLESRLKQKSG